MSHGSRLLSRTAVNGVLVLASAYMLFPLLWLTSAVGKSLPELFNGMMIEFNPTHFMDNIVSLSQRDGGLFWRWYLNSFLYAGGGAAIGALICIAAGYGFDKYNFRFKEKLFALVLVGVLIPNTALALPLYLMASRLGLVNTFWAVFVPILTFPFGVYLARVYSAAYVPYEVVEAARVDGARELATFRHIALKMLQPGYVTIFLFMFVGIWNNFFLPLVMLSDRQLFPVSYGLYVWNSQTTAFPEFYPLVIAGAFVSVVPLITAFILLQRFWRSGLTAGSVK